MDQQFSLRWNNYLNQITDAFGTLRNEEDLVDVTLSCEGRKIKAHKMLLSACSSYFRDIFKDNPCQHPVIVFRNVKYEDIAAIIDFMYQGEVNIMQDQLESFLSTAEMMEVKGLTNEATGREDDTQENYKADENISENESSVSYSSSMRRPGSPPAKKRKHTNIPNKPQEMRPKAASVKEAQTPFVGITVKEEIIEDLTIEDDEDEPPSPIGRLKTEQDFDASSTQDSLSGSMGQIDQIGHIEPGTSLESGGQDVSDENNASKRKQRQTNNSGNRKYYEKPSKNKSMPDLASKFPTYNSITHSKSKKGPLSEKSIAKGACDPKVNEQPLSKIAPSVLKNRLKLPKGITVTVRPFNLSKSELGGDQNLIDLSSKETKMDCEHPKLVISDQPAQSSHTILLDKFEREQEESPEMVAEAAPEVQPEPVDQEPIEQEPVEPEFDYFGCETCKTDGKIVDKTKIVLSHKCPICPCLCFCAHLLKEHMKVIHGWFTVQRKFTTY